MRWCSTERAYPTWADAAYLSFYVVAFAGILAFPSPRRTRSERFRLLLDMGTVFVGGTTLIWYVALGPAVASAHDFSLPNLVIFGYPVGDLLLLFGVLSLLWRGAPRLEYRVLADLRDGPGSFHRGRHQLRPSHHQLDLSRWRSGQHPLVRGAGDHVDRGRLPATRRTREDLAPPPPGRAARPSVLPYLAVAASYLLLMVVGLHEVRFNSLGGILLGALALTVLVSLRQFAALQDNGRLAVRYQELASIDGMTGLYNRRHFMEVAEGAFAHAQRLGQPLVALMIDVDRFKQINDAHGHAVGDRALADLAQSCREQVRPDDIAGRYGGDEFIIIIPGTTSLRATQIAARLTGPPAR